MSRGVSAGEKRAYGWQRQAFDPRDVYEVIPNARTRRLSQTVDLVPGMGPQLDQGQLGSCGPNTADEMITFDQIAQGLPITQASRLFIYWWTRYLMGSVNQDSGVDNRTMLKALATYGFPPESVDPYSDTLQAMTQQPSALVTQAAQVNKISDYAAVVQALPQLQGVLDSSRKPWMLGFTVFQQMESEQAASNGILTMPGQTDTPIGGHDVTACGYTNVQLPGIKPGNVWPAGTFRFRNHWINGDGTPWGDGGYGYMPYAYAVNANLAGDFWIINSIPGSTPAPTPTPIPTPTPTPIPVPPTPAPGKHYPEEADVMGLVYQRLQAIAGAHPLSLRVLQLVLNDLQQKLPTLWS